jgi:hypothetical protein
MCGILLCIPFHEGRKQRCSLAFAKGQNTNTLAHNHFVVVPRNYVVQAARPYTTFSSAAALGADPERPCAPEAL